MSNDLSATKWYKMLTIQVFAGMLNEMRVGTLTNESITAFHKLRRPLVLKDVEATEL